MMKQWFFEGTDETGLVPRFVPTLAWTRIHAFLYRHMFYVAVLGWQFYCHSQLDGDTSVPRMRLARAEYPRAFRWEKA